ncbi:hypothetical protein MMIC_P0577 [Mariprofundus micogutta]|uniref:Inner membrane protein YgaP-like transmembrane domain-containing protein n=1 Tax=Mariprofundus micogutta TaxID=1921010 RepID=A0A1L8CL26_9PROT|nr:DUF2892 domain-containing protein [Mariprofundus micogutta]GAV19628.1 hypothetical protein MMIC_P0577 [Mariprofundus micogutta]
MKANLGEMDRFFRLAFGAILIGVGTVFGLFAPWSYVVGGVLVVTALLSFCPLYPMLGINTSEKVA